MKNKSLISIKYAEVHLSTKFQSRDQLRYCSAGELECIIKAAVASVMLPST